MCSDNHAYVNTGSPVYLFQTGHVKDLHVQVPSDIKNQIPASLIHQAISIAKQKQLLSLHHTFLVKLSKNQQHWSQQRVIIMNTSCTFVVVASIHALVLYLMLCSVSIRA